MEDVGVVSWGKTSAEVEGDTYDGIVGLEYDFSVVPCAYSRRSLDSLGVRAVVGLMSVPTTYDAKE